MNTIYIRLLCALTTLVSFVSFSSCTEQVKDLWIGKTTSLKSCNLNTNISFLYIPMDLCIKDSFIITSTYNRNSFFTVYSINNNNIQELYSFGEKGEGPEDFIFPTSLRIYDKYVHFYDKALSKYITIESLDSLKIQTKNVQSLGFNNLIKLTNGDFLGDGFFSDVRFKLIQKEDTISLKIPYPSEDKTKESVQTGLAYQGDINRNPKRDQIVYTSSYGDIIEIYKSTNNGIEQIFSQQLQYPLYTPQDQNSGEISSNLSPKCIKSALCTYVTEKYIYILYSGMTMDDPMHNYSNIVHVYDWQGNPQKKYILDKHLTCIGIDEHDQFLYGVYWEIDEAKDDETIGFTKYKLDLQ